LNSLGATLVLIWLATAVIGCAYWVQYRMGPGWRRVAVAVHFAAVVAIIGSYGALCWRHFYPTPWAYLGWPLFGAGSALFWLAAFWHPACLIPRDQVGVVATGPYRYVRHPMYAGGLLAALGLIGVAPSVEVATAWMALAASLWMLVAFEERELSARLGEAYGPYRHRTKRLVPGVF
jgi:protein-S-isoprenylcysteine O-methyltransferase Ste14